MENNKKLNLEDLEKVSGGVMSHPDSFEYNGVTYNVKDKIKFRYVDDQIYVGTLTSIDYDDGRFAIPGFGVGNAGALCAFNVYVPSNPDISGILVEWVLGKA